MVMQVHEANNEKIKSEHHFFRFHLPHSHLSSVFGNDWFALEAEAFARFFGTPVFLIAQTVVVAVWITTNTIGPFTFDIYPFILLNLAFSTQAAYAACPASRGPAPGERRDVLQFRVGGISPFGLSKPVFPQTGMIFIRLFSSSMPSIRVRLKIGKSRSAASPSTSSTRVFRADRRAKRSRPISTWRRRFWAWRG